MGQAMARLALTTCELISHADAPSRRKSRQRAISLTMANKLLPDPDGFGSDPFGYSALAWHKWGLIRTANGFPTDISKSPTAEDLKDPLLWITHAGALAEAAACLVRHAPLLETTPSTIRTITHSQYYAVALMLVGYSLEVCLKAMLLLRLGVPAFLAEEKRHRHHELNRLSEFIDDLSEKDRAILELLSHFAKWAGRYPDPGVRYLDAATDIFEVSERHRVSAKDVFDLASRIMKHTRRFTE